MQATRSGGPRLIFVGEFVARQFGEGDCEYGRVIAHEEGSANKWLVSAGSHMYRDRAMDLRPLRRPWPVL